MNRRRAVGLMVAAAGGSILSACTRRPTVSSLPPRPSFQLSPVEVSPDRVVGSLVGLRPYRPSGFVVRTERLDDKVLVHNYGHGGGGLSLSWGTAQLAMEEAFQTDHRECAVLGCGVIGLSTGILLQRHGWRVTIYARQLPPNTTSNIAGGQWTPYSVYDEAHLTPQFNKQFQKAAHAAHYYFRSLIGPHYGVGWIDNYSTQDDPIVHPGFFQDLSDLYQRTATFGPGEHPFPRQHAYRYGSMLIQTPIYLRAIERDFRLGGGTVVVRDFSEVRQIGRLSEPVVINCTGLGARELFGDTELIPAKGQLTVLLPQPEVQYIVGIDEGLYMIPRQDGILLGGSFERNVWALAPNPVAAQRIFSEQSNFFGAMG